MISLLSRFPLDLSTLLWTPPKMRANSTIRAKMILIVLAVALMGGCSSSRGIRLRSVPQSPLVDRLKLTSFWGPKPSDRTLQVLRVDNLEGDLGGDPRLLLQKLQASIDREPTAEKLHAFIELAYVGAKKLEDRDPQAAVELYGASVLYAHDYLFDEFFASQRNPYDPQFRAVCDLYNGGLEGALRIACGDGELLPGRTKTINTASGTWDIACVLRGGRWQADDIDHFEFVADYEIEGLTNHYQTHGLGVPLIAVLGNKPSNSPAARYYPPGLSFPVTAFLRPVPNIDPQTGRPSRTRQCVLELYDPLTTTTTEVANRLVPLQSDLSTPLAYFLARPEMESLATTGLLDPDALL